MLFQGLIIRIMVPIGGKCILIHYLVLPLNQSLSKEIPPWCGDVPENSDSDLSICSIIRRPVEMMWLFITGANLRRQTAFSRVLFH